MSKEEILQCYKLLQENPAFSPADLLNKIIVTKKMAELSNLTIKGLLEQYKSKNTSAIEVMAIIEICKMLQKKEGDNYYV